jgi:membrane protein YqaA with SNARE-associated domain
MHLIAAIVSKKSSWRLLVHMGGPGLIVLGLIDNSAIPLPGSMDALTVILSAAHKEPWWYYALMATIGSLIGGFLTYRLGAKGGKETLEKKVSKKRAQKIYGIFERYGFWSVAIGAIAPPPVPFVPFLIAAGAMHYPRRNFLVALLLGRGVRYALLAYLGSIYGRQILGWVGRYYHPLLYALIAMGLAGGLGGLYFWWRLRRRKKNGPGSKARRPMRDVA